MKVGAINFEVVNMGYWRPDGGSMFGVVPKPIWEKWIQPDDRNRIRLATNCVWIESNGKRAIIETGNGDKFDQKEADIFAIEPAEKWNDILSRRRTKPEEIDFVINTHLHFDHAGGNTIMTNGKPARAFPNATYIFSKADLEEARNMNEK